MGTYPGNLSFGLPKDLSIGGGSGLNLGSVGTTAAGGLLAGPTGGLSVLIPLVYSLLDSLGIFGNSYEQQKERAQQELKDKLALLDKYSGYKSPNLPQMDSTMMQALMNQAGRYKNWGWPSGTGGSSILG
jgi:hypothetical protein